MSRYFIALIVACLLLLSASPVRAVELTFWTTEIHEDRLQVINFLADAFMVMQDDVTVKVVSVNENDLDARMEKAMADGSGPHLLGTGAELMVALAEMGYLDPGAASRIVRSMGPDCFYKGALEFLATSKSGTWYGVPFHGWVQGIWYRADWFEEAGLDRPATWSAILEAAKHFTDSDLGQYGILVGTADDHFAAQVFTQIAMSNGAAMFTADGQLVFDSPAMVEALEFYAKLAKCTPPGPQTWRARDFFLQGKLAMLFYSTFIMDDFALSRVAGNSLTGDNFPELDGAVFDPNLVQNVGMVPYVYREQSAGYGMINGFGLRSNLSEQEQEAAEQFLAFLYEPAQYVTWLHMAPGGMLPVLRQIAESNHFLADSSGIFRRYGRSKIKDIMNGLSSIQNFGMVNGRRQPAASVVYSKNIIPRMIQRTVFNGVSAKKSVTMAAGEIRAIVDSMKAE